MEKNANTEALMKLYAKDPELAKLQAARVGYDINEIRLCYGIKEAITGWKLGYTDGTKEALGEKAAPGAIRLGWLKLLHGDGYIMGRQAALGGAGLHGGTTSTKTLLDSTVELANILRSPLKDTE